MTNKGKSVQPQYVGVETAEAMTDRSRWSWRKDAYTGRIASVKIGRRLLIPISEIQRVMSEGLRPAISRERQ
jgi:hypothetical protein